MNSYKKLYPFIGLVLLLFSVLITDGQTLRTLNGDYRLQTMSAETVRERSVEWLQENQTAIYALLVFEQMPSNEQKEMLDGKLDRLLYMPDRSWYIRLKSEISEELIRETGIIGLYNIQPHWKINDIFNSPEAISWALGDEGMISVRVSVLPGTLNLELRQRIQDLSGETPVFMSNDEMFEISMSFADLERLAAIPEIYWIDAVPPPVAENNWVERTNHRVPMVESKAGVFDLSGKGVIVGEWDGTAAGPHIDYDDRHTAVEGFSNTNGGRHATHVAGTVLGAGIIDPEATGMAPEATLFSWNFGGIITNEMDTGAARYGVEITQNSYSYSTAFDRCTRRSSYDANSRAIDLLVNKYPYLLHVYAAGNSRSSNCLPGGYGTVASGYQAGKNTLVVAAVTRTDGNSSFHAYGPMKDGRLKPEISAVGVNVNSTFPYNNYQSGYSGTSMACPGISGSGALLYEQYETMVGDRPPSHLIKNLLCNGAEDLGRPGPDFQYGFGRVNVWNSARILEEGRYKVDDVSQNGVFADTLRLRRGTGQFKLMLCWDDPAAASNASVSLVNDLDLILIDPNGDTIRPWVCDPTNYTRNAQRLKDNLNNIEQITLDNPSYTVYIAQVLGRRVTGSQQSFSLSWMSRDTGLQITYPNGGENWMPPSNSGSAQIIRWDVFGLGGLGLLEYSIDSGQNWNVISNTVDLARGYYDWRTCPSNTRSGKVLIRISQSTYTDQSDGVFSIFPQMASPSAVVCDSQVHLKWNALTGAVGYRVWMNIDGGMTPLDTTSNEFFTVRKLNNDSAYWFAVSAIGSDGAEGMRSRGVRFIPRSTYSPVRYTLQPKDTTLCEGSDLRLEVDFTGTNPVNWKWQYSTNEGKNWLDAGVSNNKNLLLNNLSLALNQRMYRVEASNRCESLEHTEPIKLQIDTSLQFNYAHNRLDLCLGQDSLIEVNYIGPNEPVSRWYYQSSLSAAPIKIGDFEQANLPLPNVRAGAEGYYFAELENSCGLSTNVVRVFVNVHDTLQLSISGNDSICIGQEASMRLTANGGNALNYRYGWASKNRFVSGPFVRSSPDSTELWKTWVYDGCSADTVELDVILPVREPLSMIKLEDTLICQGNPVLLRAEVGGGDRTLYSYDWSGSLGNAAQHLVYPQSDTVFTLAFTDQCTEGVLRDTMRIWLREPLSVTILSSRDTLCYEQPQRFNLQFGGGKSDQYKFLWMGEERSASEMFSFTESGWLKVELEDACTVEPGRDSMWIHVFDSIQLNILGPANICQGTGGLYRLDIQGGHPDRSRWQINWNGQAGTDSLHWIPVRSGFLRATASDACTPQDGGTERIIQVYDSLRIFALQDEHTICKGEEVEIAWGSTGGRRGTLYYSGVGPSNATSTVVSPGDTTIYTIMVRDNCTQPEPEVQIKVNVRPPLELNAGPDLHQCLGDDIEIELAGEGGLAPAYVFFADGKELSGNRFRTKVVGNQFITFRLNDDCTVEDALDTLQIEVSDFSSNAIYIGEQKNLNLSFYGRENNHEVRWNFGEGAGWEGGEISAEHRFSSYGNKTVCRIEIDSLGCFDTVCRQVRVFDVFNTSGFSIDIYPNPANDHIKISLGDVAGAIELRLYSIEGKLLYELSEENYTNQEYRIPLSSLARGMYLLRLRANEEERIVKVVKE